MSPAEPLCLCGVRGCELAVEHAQAFVVIRRRRRHRGGRKPRQSRN